MESVVLMSTFLVKNKEVKIRDMGKIKENSGKAA